MKLESFVRSTIVLAFACRTWCVAVALVVSGKPPNTTTPLPYGGLPYVAPNPYIVWVDSALLPTTTPPLYSQCHGCDCLQLIADGFVVAGAVLDQYKCTAGPQAVPSLKWSGFDGVLDISFAVTVTDLDEPNGVSAIGNRVSPIFWAANIPYDVRELSETKIPAAAVIGRNRNGNLAIEPICPQRGKHRIGVTVWAVRSSLPALSSDTPYTEVMEQLEAAELARATVFAAAASVDKAQALLETKSRHLADFPVLRTRLRSRGTAAGTP